jgi:serine/threonine protein phosphatase PrpC
MFKLWKKNSKKAGADKARTAPLRRQTRAAEAPAAEAPAAQDMVGRAGKFEIVASVQTDVGCHRELNEDCGRIVQPGDSALLAKKGRLVVVADGMGGHSAGEVASSMAVEVINRSYYDDPDDAPSALKNAFHEANRRIHESSLRDKSRNGMGTTCTALVLWNGSALAAHVGDSRLYLIRNEQIYLMTEDHSAVMELVKRGLLTLADARHHPDKNVILRALGSHPSVEVTSWEVPLPVRDGDRFLLCSDGLYDLVEDNEIMSAVISEDPHGACGSLITLAKNRGGYDNITVAVLAVSAAESAAPEPVRATREFRVGASEE